MLKDGTEVTLTLVNKDNRDRLISFYASLSETDRWFLTEDTLDPQVIDSWLENQEKGNSFCIVATFDEVVVAHACLLMRRYGGRNRIGRLRVMVSRDFRGRRLGTWMIFDLTRRAMELGLEKLRADFVVGIDDPAIEAVKKMDFFRQGLLENYLLDQKGKKYDYIIMTKNLHKDWSDF